MKMTSQEDVYAKLWPLRVPKSDLSDYEYPIRDAINPGWRLPLFGPHSFTVPIFKEFQRGYKCKRCNTLFEVDQEGVAKERYTCFHHGSRFKFNNQWSCCNREIDDSINNGCVIATHAHDGVHLEENYRGYVATVPKDNLEPNRHGVFALDCEMVDTAYGLELARVSVVDYKGRVVYDQLVKPTNQIINYNTVFNGLNASQLNPVTTRLADVQLHLRSMFSDKTIIVGHSLDSDMKALKLFHDNFVDTVILYPHRRSRYNRVGLIQLIKNHLKITGNREGPHDSVADARHALQLAYLKANISVQIEY